MGHLRRPDRGYMRRHSRTGAVDGAERAEGVGQYRWACDADGRRAVAAGSGYPRRTNGRRERRDRQPWTRLAR